VRGCLNDTWQTQEWKEKAAEFIKGKNCEWCGSTENLVPHHPKRKGGYTHSEYVSLDGCFVLCTKCNFMEDLGFRICPNCKKHYYKPKRGKESLCWECFAKTPFGQKVKEYYEKHPGERKRNRRIKH
jgi:hypothetical protein